jgi:hypothetical protein
MPFSSNSGNFEGFIGSGGWIAEAALLRGRTSDLWVMSRIDKCNVSFIL